ncbi:hypothetical protein ABPG75_010863 [Micractinium tetrahymenae]
MDWQITLKRLLADTESNLRQSGLRRSSQAPKAPLVGAGSYALLRQGVSPRDPHLIAPAVPGACGSPVCTAYCGGSDGGVLTDGLIAAARPLSPLRPAAAAENGRGWRQELSALGEQLRSAAAGWQGLAAAVTSVQSSSAAQAGQLAGLSSGVADLRAAQGRLEQAAAQQRLETQGRLAELGGRLDALAACPPPPPTEGHATWVGSSSSARAASAAEREARLAPLAARLSQMEAAVAGLQARVGQAAEAAPAAPASSAELAALQAQLAALQHAQRSAVQRQEEHAAQSVLLSGQLAELGAAQSDNSRQLSTRLEQLAEQLAGLGAQMEEQRQCPQGPEACSSQEQQHARAFVTAGLSLERFEQLAEQVAMGAAAVQGLQAQVGPLAGLPAALDDVNQRLFELRVEVQNAGEDSAISTASIKRQAEAAERQAEEAADAVAEVCQLAGTLRAELAQVQQQVAAVAVCASSGGIWAGSDAQLPAPLAALIQQQVAAGVEGARGELAGQGSEKAAAEMAAVAQTVDRLAAELAGVKLLLAQQHEAAEAAVAAARADSDATQDRCVHAALSAAEQLLQQHSPATLATTEETAACLATLSDIVHRQQDELLQVQQGLASLEQAVAASTAAAASAAAAAVAGTSTGSSAGIDTADTLEFLSAAVEQLQGQLGAAMAAAEQRQAAQASELAALRQQLVAAQQEAAAGAHAVRQDVAAMQRHLAVVEESSEGGLGDAPVRPQLEEMQRRLAEMEAALAQQAQQAGQAQQVQPGEEAATSATSAGLAALQSRIEGLEAALLAQQQHTRQLWQESGAQGLPAEARQEVDSRMQRTEATVAEALEEVAAQMAALSARTEAAEASAAASVAHAAAAATATAQAQGLPSRRSSLGEHWQAQLSPRGVPAAAAAAGGQPQQHSRSLSRSRQQPEHSYAELHRQRSQSRPAAQQRQQQQQQQPGEALGSPRRISASGISGSRAAPAAATGTAPPASPGLFARLSRSLSGHGRRSSSGQESGRSGTAADAIAAAATADAALAGVGMGQSQQEEEVPLRVQYSSSGGREADWEGSREGGSAPAQLGGGGSGSAADPASAAAAAGAAAAQPALARQRTRSRTDSTGSASGSGTPRGAAGPGKYTPRSRHWASLQQELLHQERSTGADGDGIAGPSSTVSTPRQQPSAFSSFGELPLPASASSGLLASPREGLEEQAARIEAEMAGAGLDELQREVMASDLARLRRQMAHT